MAENQNAQINMNFPSRNILITSERVARMAQMTIMVSRLDQRLTHLALSGTSQNRASFRKASESFNRIVENLEAELKALDKEIGGSSRGTQRRSRGNGSVQPAPSPTGSQQKSSKAPKTPQPKKAQAAQKANDPGAGKAAPAQANAQVSTPAELSPEQSVNAAEIKVQSQPDSGKPEAAASQTASTVESL
jgi:hypothetical protein